MYKLIAYLLLLSIAFATGKYYFSRTPFNVVPMLDSNNSATLSAQPAQPESRYLKTFKTSDDVQPARRVYFFYANWCTTCIPADANLEKNKDRIPLDTRVIRVNYNDSDTDAEEKALAARYNVVYQHTFVQIDSQGNVVTRWNGGQIEELLKNLK